MINILKRFEVWLLIALVIAAIFWALKADPAPISSGSAKLPEELADNTSLGIEENKALLEIKDIQYIPEQGGGIVAVTLLGRSGTEDQVALDDSTVEMLSSEGDVIRRFVTPFASDPILKPDESSLVTLRYWLVEPVETLWLTYQDQTFKVVLPPA